MNGQTFANSRLLLFIYMHLCKLFLFNRLRRDLEEAHIQHESTVASLKKKHQDATSEMAEQVT